MVLFTSHLLQAVPSSGGVPLIIVGTNLDVAVSPMLTLTVAGVQLINVVSAWSLYNHTALTTLYFSVQT